MAGLLLTFLSAVGAAIGNKMIGKEIDKTKTADSIGGRIADFITEKAEKIAGNKTRHFLDSLRGSKLPQYDEINNAVNKSFYQAGIEVARYCIDEVPVLSKPDKKKLLLIESGFKRELTVLKKGKILSETENPASGYLEQLDLTGDSLEGSDTAKRLSDSLHNHLFYQAKLILVAKGYPAGEGLLPACFEQTAVHGWTRSGNEFTFFQFMCDYFQEAIKTDPRLQAILENQWLAQSKMSMQELGLDISQTKTVTQDIRTELQELGNNSIQHSRKLDEIIRLLKVQPELRFDYSSEQRTNALFYRSRIIPFVGRDVELTQLLTFKESDALFSWWGVGGPAGTGKSRLAMECCYQLASFQQGNFGFISKQQVRNFDWMNWQPLAETFIVIDYASLYEDELNNLLQILYDRQETFSNKVRVLVLDRAFSGNWWKKITDHVAIESFSKPWQEPLMPDAIPPDKNWEIIHFFLKDVDIDDDEKALILENFAKLDPFMRPLYAALYAQVIARDPLSKYDSIDDILHVLLLREEKKIWENSGADELIKARTKWLVCMSVITGGLKYEEVSALTERTEYFQDVTERELQQIVKLYGLIAPIDDEHEYSFRPLAPDVIGEYFVLRELTKTDPWLSKKYVASQMVEQAWQVSPADTASFARKILQDFDEEKYRTITELFNRFPNVSEYTIAWNYWFSYQQYKLVNMLQLDQYDQAIQYFVDKVSAFHQLSLSAGGDTLRSHGFMKMGDILLSTLTMLSDYERARVIISTMDDIVTRFTDQSNEKMIMLGFGKMSQCAIDASQLTDAKIWFLAMSDIVDKHPHDDNYVFFVMDTASQICDSLMWNRMHEEAQYYFQHVATRFKASGQGEPLIGAYINGLDALYFDPFNFPGDAIVVERYTEAYHLVKGGANAKNKLVVARMASFLVHGYIFNNRFDEAIAWMAYQHVKEFAMEIKDKELYTLWSQCVTYYGYMDQYKSMPEPSVIAADRLLVNAGLDETDPDRNRFENVS